MEEMGALVWWGEGPPGLPGSAPGRRAGEVGRWAAESASWRAGAPVLEQQDPEQLVSGLRPDLLLVDKPIQQLVGHSCQGGLRQIQEDGTCKGWRGEPDGRTVALRPATTPHTHAGLGEGPRGAYPWQRLSAAPGGSRK